MEAKLKAPATTVGIEEGLMIFAAPPTALVNRIEDLPHGEIKPELLESVLEISTKPTAGLGEAGEQLRGLRRQVRDKSAEHGLAIGSRRPHPLGGAGGTRRAARAPHPRP